MKKTQKVAQKGETTLKRAMEIIESAFPIFLSIWGKSQEELVENDKIDEAFGLFDEARQEVLEAGFDVDKRITKSEECSQHIGELNFNVK